MLPQCLSDLTLYSQWGTRAVTRSLGGRAFPHIDQTLEKKWKIIERHSVDSVLSPLLKLEHSLFYPGALFWTQALVHHCLWWLILIGATYVLSIDAFNTGGSWYLFPTPVTLSINGWHRKVNFHREEKKKRAGYGIEWAAPSCQRPRGDTMGINETKWIIIALQLYKWMLSVEGTMECALV